MTYPVNNGSASRAITSRIRGLTAQLDKIERSNQALRGEVTKERNRRNAVAVELARTERRLRGALYQLYGSWDRVREEMSA